MLGGNTEQVLLRLQKDFTTDAGRQFLRQQAENAVGVIAAFSLSPYSEHVTVRTLVKDSFEFFIVNEKFSPSIIGGRKSSTGKQLMDVMLDKMLALQKFFEVPLSAILDDPIVTLSCQCRFPGEGFCRFNCADDENHYSREELSINEKVQTILSLAYYDALLCSPRYIHSRCCE